MTEPTLLNLAVVGAGRLGSVHARVATELPGARLVGVYDTRPEVAQSVAKSLRSRVFLDLNAVAEAADAVVVAVPTSEHHAVAGPLLDAGVPCLVEKPLARTVDEGHDLVARARRSGAALMVGHVERFNPAVMALCERGTFRPRFVEAHRVSPFSFRATDVGVVLDMMIHDIDLILHLVRSEVASVHAVGVSVVGDHEDLANARLVFRNGAVANVTASRLALKTERKLRFFAPDGYVSLDLLEKKGTVITPGPKLREAIEEGRLDLERLSPLEVMVRRLVRKEDLEVRRRAEPLKEELSEFLASLREGRAPLVTGEHGVAAMETAAAVVASIRANSATASAP